MSQAPEEPHVSPWFVPCFDTGCLLPVKLTFNILFCCPFGVMSIPCSCSYWLKVIVRKCLYQTAREDIAIRKGFPAKCLRIKAKVRLCRLAQRYQLQLVSVKSILAAADELGGSTKQVQSVSFCTSLHQQSKIPKCPLAAGTLTSQCHSRLVCILFLQQLYAPSH